MRRRNSNQTCSKGIQFSEIKKEVDTISLMKTKTGKLSKCRAILIRKPDPKIKTNKRDCRQVIEVESNEEETYTKWFTVNEKSIFRVVIKRRMKNKTELKSKQKQSKQKLKPSSEQASNM